MCVFRLRQPPQTLGELSASLKLLETLKGDMAKTEAQIPLIHEQFALLEKYEVPVEQEVSTSLIDKEINTQTQIIIHYRLRNSSHLIKANLFIVPLP